MNWIVGLFVSLVIGGIVTPGFLWALRKWMRLGAKPLLSNTLKRRVPPWLMGGVERLFFTLAVGFDVSGVAPAMAGWIALKLAANWSAPDRSMPDKHLWAVSALLAGLVSMLFAMLGGIIARTPTVY